MQTQKKYYFCFVFLNFIEKFKMLKVTRFTATWCQPCKVLAPVLEQLSQSYSDKASFSTVDVDDNRQLAIAKSVTSVPTVIFEKDGIEIARIIGLRPKSSYEQVIKNNQNG